MKKSIFLFFAAILCAFSMNVQADNLKGGEVLYLKPNSNWTQANARFAIYLFGGTSGNEWVSMTKSGDYYMATIPAGDYKELIFCRMNPDASANNWDNKWNQSGDLSFDQIKNLCTINSGQWDCGENVTWSTYQPVSDASLISSVTDIFVGAQATLIPSLSTNANVNTIKSIDYSINPATGASITGNTFTATAEGTYEITATITYYPNGCTKLASGLKTATPKTTIKAEVPAEEVHDVTVSYMCGSTKVADPTTINTVGVETPVKVTAPEIAKYTFANWTLGADVATTDALTSNEINITTKAGGSDFTLVANYEKAKLTYTVTVPAGTENCYLVGAMNGWDVANPIEMTKQGENVFTTTLEGVATTDEYKYISQKGSWDYADVQESNRTWSANDVVTAWKDPLATNVYLVGNMFTNWDKTPDKEFRKTTKDATTASIVVALDANKDYELKVRRGDDWTSCTSKITNTVTGLQFSSSNNDNCKMKTTVAGEYTFTWTISSSKLDVTYPAIYVITATANNAAMGTVAGAGDYGKGSTATLTATPNDGYLFVNWTKGSEEVSTDATYSFKVEEAVELVANFEAAAEEVHNVTVSYVCGGNKIAEDQTVAAVGETTAKTVEAPAVFGYTFSSWTLGAGVTSANELTSNTIDINIVAGGSDYTLTANYTEIPKVTVYFVNNKNWSKVQVYGWKDGEEQGTPGWPGNNITVNKEAEQVAGFDVYSYSVVPGSYDNIIFNNKEGDSGEQTETFKWTDGKYYYVDATKNYAGGTAEEVATALGSIVTYDYYLTGSLVGGWDVKQQGIEKDGELYKVTFNALAAGTYEFKITAGDWEHQWNYNNLGAAYEEVSQGVDGEGNPNENIKIVTEEAKNITVIFDATAGKITFDGLTEKTINYVDIKFTITANSAPQIHYWGDGITGTDWENLPSMTPTANPNEYTFTIENVDQEKGVNYLLKIGELQTADQSTKTDVVADFKDLLPLISIYGIVDWNAANAIHLTIADDYATATANIELAAETTYEFKVNIGAKWLGNVSTMTSDNCTGWTFAEKNGEEDMPNAGITTTIAGEYTFTWNVADNKLSVTYPTPLPATYTREVTSGNFGTICLPYAGTITGATLFVLSYKDENYVYVDEIGTTLEAGKPYLFLPTSTEITVNYTDNTYKEAGENGALRGTYVEMNNAALMGKYIISGNKYYLIDNATGNSRLPENRAYFVLDDVSPSEPVLAPGARRIALGTNGQNTATGVDQVQGDEVPTKMIINGQLFILRGEKMYDAQGKLVK